MFLAKSITLIFKGNELHSDIFEIIFQSVLIQVKIFIIFPQLNIFFLLVNPLRKLLNLLGNKTILVLDSKNIHKNLALILILPAICLNQFLIKFFLSYSFLSIEYPWLNFLRNHIDLISYPLNNLLFIGNIPFHIFYLICDAFIFIQLLCIWPYGRLRRLQILLEIGNLFLENKDSILFLLVVQSAWTMTLGDGKLSWWSGLDHPLRPDRTPRSLLQEGVLDRSSQIAQKQCRVGPLHQR